MAKRIAAPKSTANPSLSLIDAISAVKQLQDFIKEHGSWEAALAAVVRVQSLIEVTGGVDALKQALEIVGKEETPPQA
jgi:hypothetical protein